MVANDDAIRQLEHYLRLDGVFGSHTRGDQWRELEFVSAKVVTGNEGALCYYDMRHSSVIR